MFDASQPGAPLTLDGVWLTLPSTAGPVEILRGLDFSVAAGERVAVVGPSGSGKSTLIAVAAGLERPDAWARRAPAAGQDLALASTRTAAPSSAEAASPWSSRPSTSAIRN